MRKKVGRRFTGKLFERFVKRCVIVKAAHITQLGYTASILDKLLCPRDTPRVHKLLYRNAEAAFKRVAQMVLVYIKPLRKLVESDVCVLRKVRRNFVNTVRRFAVRLGGRVFRDYRAQTNQKQRERRLYRRMPKRRRIRRTVGDMIKHIGQPVPFGSLRADYVFLPLTRHTVKRGCQRRVHKVCELRRELQKAAPVLLFGMKNYRMQLVRAGDNHIAR